MGNGGVSDSRQLICRRLSNANLRSCEEEAKMHDYLMLGLDMVFKEKGVKPISELAGTQE
jgi:hypothetical protein